MGLDSYIYIGVVLYIEKEVADFAKSVLCEFMIKFTRYEIIVLFNKLDDVLLDICDEMDACKKHQDLEEVKQCEIEYNAVAKLYDAISIIYNEVFGNE